MYILKFFHPIPKPYSTGYLPESDGHKIYYHQFGNKKGHPVIFFHGGPGSQSKFKHANNFDLKKFRVILFDQRGCGKSVSKDALHNNTIHHTMQDAVRLLKHLDISEKVVSAGNSFGSTCAILFAEIHPNKVRHILSISTFLARKKDEDCIYDNIAEMFYPDVLEMFKSEAKNKSIKEYYYKLICSNKKLDQYKVVKTFVAFELQLGLPSISFAKFEITDTVLQSTKVFMHYFYNSFFLKKNQLIKDAKNIFHIPTSIYTNRLDMICPPYQSYELHKSLPKSNLIIFPDTGHGSNKLSKFLKKDFAEKF